MEKYKYFARGKRTMRKCEPSFGSVGRTLSTVFFTYPLPSACRRHMLATYTICHSSYIFECFQLCSKTIREFCAFVFIKVFQAALARSLLIYIFLLVIPSFPFPI